MKIKNACFLFFAAAIWGTGFVSQSLGLDYLEPFAFNGIRNIIGCLSLLPVIAIMGFLNKKEDDHKEKNQKEDRKNLIKGGVCCGLCLFVASTLQQYGVKYTTVGKAGFITAFYIVLVPVLGIFLHKHIGIKVWVAVVIAITGLYFLCITDGFSIGKGDVYVFLCALVFAVHILVIDHFAPKTDGVKLSCIQFLLVGILSMPFMVTMQMPTFSDVMHSLGPLLYSGVISSGVAYTFQILGQEDVNPAIASLILSLESTVSVIAGWLILGQHLSMREGFGCVLMFVAITLAQIPDKSRELSENKNN